MENIGRPTSSSSSTSEVRRCCCLTKSQWNTIIGIISGLLITGMAVSAYRWNITAHSGHEPEYLEFWRSAVVVCGLLLIPCVFVYFCLQSIFETGDRSTQSWTSAPASSIEVVSPPQTPIQVQVQKPQVPNIATISQDDVLHVEVHEPPMLQEQPHDDVETASTYSTSSVETIRLQPDVPEPVMDPIRTRARARAAEGTQRRRTKSERAEPVVTRSRVHAWGSITPPRLPSEIVLLPGQLPEDPQAMGSGEMRRRRFIAAQFEKRKSPRSSKPYDKK